MKKLCICALALSTPAAAVDFGPSGSDTWVISGTCQNEGGVVDTYNGRLKDEPAPTRVDSGWLAYIPVDTTVICRNHRFTRYGKFYGNEPKVAYMWVGSGVKYKVDFVRYSQISRPPPEPAYWTGSLFVPPISPNESLRVTVPIRHTDPLGMYYYNARTLVTPNCASVAVDPIDGTKPLSVTITGIRACSYTALLEIVGSVR